MTAWIRTELEKIAEADDLHIAPFSRRQDDLRHADMDLVGRR